MELTNGSFTLNETHFYENLNDIAKNCVLYGNIYENEGFKGEEVK